MIDNTPRPSSNPSAAITSEIKNTTIVGALRFIWFSFQLADRPLGQQLALHRQQIRKSNGHFQNVSCLPTVFLKFDFGGNNEIEDYTRSFKSGDWRFCLLASSGWDTTILVILGLEPSIHDSSGL